MMATHTVAAGRLDWIGVRPARLQPLLSLEQARLGPEGIEGDHGRPGKRAVTLIQAEHLPVIAALSGNAVLTPDLLRRNLVISGINLMALRKGRLRLGEVVLELTGPCAPCSRMEKALGPGGFNAMRGHGGWCASVVEPGTIRRGDRVAPT